MAVTKKIEIDGQEVTFKASAAVPRLYRIKFGRDIYEDLRQLEKSVGENDEDNSNLDLFSLEMFEDLAWLMARHADPANVPDSPDEKPTYSTSKPSRAILPATSRNVSTLIWLVVDIAPPRSIS